MVDAKPPMPDPDDEERDFAVMMTVKIILERSRRDPLSLEARWDRLSMAANFRNRIYSFKGNWWYRHTRGFDELLQEGWGIIYACPIQKTEEEH